MDLIVRKLGTLSHSVGLEVQLEARSRVLGGGPDELLLLEHDAVVTLGRRGGQVDRDTLGTLGTQIVQTDRGGQATWHGPGQLVGYPIVDLRRRALDIRAMVDGLGKAMEDVSRGLGLPEATYEGDRPGVYIRGRKLGAIGMHIHHGVTTHGFALNVDCDLRGFQAIEPCGDPALETTTLSRELGTAVSMDDVIQRIEKALRLGPLP